jgi:pyruvate formate lyase activating enzyme
MDDRQPPVTRKPEWTTDTDRGTACILCPRACLWTADRPLGACRVRGLENGVPALPGYGRCVSLSIDPIEKKPLFHFAPGSMILSTGPAGCNLACDFCQNWSISQSDYVPARYVSPRELADLAFMEGSSGIAYTYTEPTVWFEYIVDSAPLVRERGGSVVMVSNGYVNPGPLEALLEVTDAWNVDIKAWSDDFYRERCDGRRDAVLRSIEIIAGSGRHLELTFLVIPGYNDDPAEWAEMASWIRETCGADTPVHVSRYFPRYRLQAPPTPAGTIREAVELFSRQLNFVYPGNLHGEADTTCPSCGATVIRRRGYSTDVSGLEGGRCGSCGADLGIVDASAEG